MNIQPNSKLQYKEGRQRVSVVFHNEVNEGIYLTVHVQQASRHWKMGDGYYHSYNQSVTGCNDEVVEAFNKAVAANQ